MKPGVCLSVLILSLFFFISCKREFSLEGGNGISSGSLKTLSGDCMPSGQNGIFKKGTVADSSNYIYVDINVISPGSYLVSSDSVDGLYFKGEGIFTATGVQTVSLYAHGTPIANGMVPYPVKYHNQSCIVNVFITDPSAVTGKYTLGGTGNSCTGVVLSGTYSAGTAMSAANKASLDVVVTTIGTYNIGTTSINGINFSASGNFTAAGAQQVTLLAAGTPVAAGDFSFNVTENSSACSFLVPFSPSAQPAAFTLSGMPGACAVKIVNGTYTAGIAMTAANTIVIKADVTTAGSYTITTDVANGISFSGSGIFASTGPGLDVTLFATGTPVTAGMNTFTPKAGTSSCTFAVTTGAGLAVTDAIFNCKVNGLYVSFADRGVAQTDNSGIPYLFLDGHTGAANGGNVPELQMFVMNNNNSSVKAGAYNVDGLLLPNGYKISVIFSEVYAGLVTNYLTGSTIFLPNPPFTITVTSATSSRIKGTFSGSLTASLLTRGVMRGITEGVFDLPIQ
jgi:hypothetical protein